MPTPFIRGRQAPSWLLGRHVRDRRRRPWREWQPRLPEDRNDGVHARRGQRTTAGDPAALKAVAQASWWRVDQVDGSRSLARATGPLVDRLGADVILRLRAIELPVAAAVASGACDARDAVLADHDCDPESRQPGLCQLAGPRA